MKYPQLTPIVIPTSTFNFSIIQHFQLIDLSTFQLSNLSTFQYSLVGRPLGHGSQCPGHNTMDINSNLDFSAFSFFNISTFQQSLREGGRWSRGPRNQALILLISVVIMKIDNFRTYQLSNFSTFQLSLYI